MTTREDIYEDGEAHGLHGCPEDVCPHGAHPRIAKIWLRGWREGRRQMRPPQRKGRIVSEAKTTRDDLAQAAAHDVERAGRRIGLDPAWDLVGRLIRGEDLSKPTPSETRQEHASQEWLDKTDGMGY